MDVCNNKYRRSQNKPSNAKTLRYEIDVSTTSLHISIVVKYLLTNILHWELAIYQYIKFTNTYIL